jgi:signal transduction histidine kinase
METFIQQIFDIITSSPGNLIVHLALAITVMVSMQTVLVARQSNPTGLSGRMLLGLSAVLFGQLVMFAASGLAWQGIFDQRTILPPLDRAVITWSLVWIAWLWSAPKKAHTADTINGLLNLIVVIFLLFTFTGWAEADPQQFFNITWYDVGWGIFSTIILLGSILFLVIQRPEAWGIGLGLLLWNLGGHVAHVLWGNPGSDYAAAVRLAQLASYPLLPSLAHRLIKRPVDSSRTVQTTEADNKRRYTADPRAIYAWLQVAVEREPEKLRTALVRAVAQTMLADLCFLVQKPAAGGGMAFEYGYDLIRDEDIASKTINQADIPNLAGAVLRGRPIRLGDTGQVGPDLNLLAHTLELEKPGNLLSIPLSAGEQNCGSIVLLSPYSGRVWSTADQNYLLSCMESVVHLLDRPAGAAPAALPTDLPEASRDGDLNSEQIENLKTLAAHLHEENRELKARLVQVEDSNRSGELESLLVVQRESQAVIRQLQEENDRFRAALDGVGEHPTLTRVEEDLRASLREVARLQNALAEANMKNLDLEMRNRPNSAEGQDIQAAMFSTMQELRQPITSIIGYTELLMGETIGLLGTLQRKFLERVQASTERMRGLLDDLIRIHSIEGGKLELSSDLVDTADVIDTVIAATRHTMQEKGIVLSLDLPDTLPKLQADRDAIEQVLIHLLQNASSVTPPDGLIHFRAAVEDSEEQPYLLLQVTDSGGGIAPEDLPRIFFRHFRAESPLIQGIGGTGIGLSIAKVLVEAHNGRIWVDSVSDKSATFSVLIPVRQIQPENSTASYESFA